MRLPSTLPLTLALSLSLGAAAPGIAAEPAVSPPAAPDISVVTVLGKLTKRPSAAIRRLNRSSASSCAFSSLGHADDLIDAYLDHFQGRGRDTDGDAEPGSYNAFDGTEDPLNPDADNRGFRDTSTYGDAKTGSAPRPTGTGPDGVGVGCGQSDRNAAAGRNYIARKDKSIDEAYAAFDAKDYSKAMERFKVSYNKVGWDEAALAIGTMYHAGLGTPVDTQQAIGWFGKVANARLTKEQYAVYNPKDPHRATPRIEAQLRLAQLYLAGDGVPADAAQARKWYKEADKLNYIPARFMLGRMLLTGQGGAKDVAGALALINDAAEHGYVAAQWTLAKHYGAAGDHANALVWAQQTAFNPVPGLNKPHAQLKLARFYDQGVGVKADPARALAFYKLAAVAGHPDAQNALATYFYEGQLVGKDLAVGRKLFVAAAAQGQRDAMVNAGVMLFKGEGGVADLVQAYVWLKLAEQLGDARAPAMAALVEKRLTPEQRGQADAVLKPKARS